MMASRVWRVAMVVAMASLVCAGATAAGTSVPVARPQLTIQTLNGHTFRLSAERGKWVIVNYWATWCSPCIAEMPAISRFVASHPNVTAIGLAWDHSPLAKLRKFARQHPVDYPLAKVDLQHPPAAFPAPAALPVTWLVAPDGHVAKHFVGPVDAKQLAAAIDLAHAAPAGAASRASGG